VAEGGRWVEPELTIYSLSAREFALTPRQQQLMDLVALGKRNKEIAFQLGTTEQVIKNYLRKIYDKLGVSDRLELALYCLHNKIIKSDADEVVVAQKIVTR